MREGEPRDERARRGNQDKLIDFLREGDGAKFLEAAQKLNVSATFYESDEFLLALSDAFFQAKTGENGGAILDLIKNTAIVGISRDIILRAGKKAAYDLFAIPDHKYEAQGRALVEVLGAPEILENPGVAKLLRPMPSDQVPAPTNVAKRWTTGWSYDDDEVDAGFESLQPKQQVLRRVVESRMDDALAIARSNGISPRDFADLLVNDEKARRVLDKYEEKLVRFYRFEELGRLVEGTGREFPLDPTKVDKILRELLNSGMSVVARECLTAIENSGMRVASEDLRGHIVLAAAEEDARRERRAPREISQSRDIPKTAHGMAAVFYAESRILQYVEILMQDMLPGGVDFSFSTKLRLNEMRNDLRADVDVISARLQEFVVVALHSELQLQGELSDKIFDVNTPPDFHDAKGLFRYGTREENITYISRAKLRFAQRGWSAKYGGWHGGKMWEKIAEVGENLFRHPDRTNIMDNVFDLEHNSQAIFGKDPDLLAFDDAKLHALKTGAVLDVKRQARGNTRALVRVMRETLSGEDKMFDRLDTLVDRWVDILHSVERTYLANGKKFNYEQYI